MQELEKGQYSGSVQAASAREGLIISMTSYDADDFNSALHYHDNTHISLVVEGGSVEKRRAACDRLPGKITYYSAQEPHQVLRVYKDAKHINLEIEDVFFKEYGLSDACLHDTFTKEPGAGLWLIRMYKELLAADSSMPASIQMLLLQFLHKGKCSRREITIPVWMKKVQDYLHTHWNEKVTLQQLSAASGIHPVSISHYFPVYFSCTLGEYMRRLKITKAAALIKLSPPSLTDVAFECGFADQSHFIRTFKQLTGFLPAAYQKL